jgi:hypothetical protein
VWYHVEDEHTDWNVSWKWNGSRWEEAACPGYQTERFPEDNLIAVPVSQVGVYVWSDKAPESQVEPIYLPAIMKGSP